MDRLLSLLKFAEVRAESEKKNSKSQQERSSQIRPRLLFFGSSQSCDDDEEDEVTETTYPVVIEEGTCDDDDDDDDDDDRNNADKDSKDDSTSSGGASKKLGCMYNGARFGLREGALTGAFFGGGLGLYKYFDAVLKGGGDKGGSDDSESTVNENIIFVSAANGAIAMAVFCTLFCSTKAMIYCN